MLQAILLKKINKGVYLKIIYGIIITNREND